MARIKTQPNNTRCEPAILISTYLQNLNKGNNNIAFTQHPPLLNVPTLKLFFTTCLLKKVWQTCTSAVRTWPSLFKQ